MKLSAIPDIITDIQQGRFVILVDDENRENEGDLVIAADHISPEAVNFMAVHARGLICLALSAEQVDRLELPLMVREETNGTRHSTAFTVSIEAARGVSTGISAADRALTIRIASSPNSGPQDVIMPGHVFPIRAQKGGVLRRAGHTEASVDLAHLAGLQPAAVICEIMNADGSMARLPDLLEFAQRHQIRVATIEQLIEYRLTNESFVQQTAVTAFESSEFNGFEMRVFRNWVDQTEHLVLSKGYLRESDEPLLVRVHQENTLGDLFAYPQFGSESLLRLALKRIDRAGRGALVYLRKPQSLESSIRGEYRTDDRDYGVGAQILRALGVRQIRLLTNNPTRKIGLKAFGLEIVEALPLEDV